MLIALVLSLAVPAQAWNDHRLLTQAATAELDFLDGKGKAETLAEYLQATGFAGGEKAFLVSLKLNQNAAFPFSAGETAGQPISLRAVLEKYSDEPDWTMDMDLFSQYPELWKDEYRYMGGGAGYLSRVFRHLYWPNGFYREPLPPDTMPRHDPTVLGEAPERAQLYFDLSKKAFQEGHPYWGARFLGWALHYLEDATQPFHAVQLPALEFIVEKPDGTPDLERSTKLVIYHHLSIDNYPTRAIEGRLGDASAARVKTQLGGTQAAAFTGARELTAASAEAAAKQAGRLGKRGLEFFPEMTPADEQDILARVFSDRYWEDVKAAQAADPAAAEAFLAMLDKALAPAGAAARAFILSALEFHPGFLKVKSPLPEDPSWVEKRVEEFEKPN